MEGRRRDALPGVCSDTYHFGFRVHRKARWRDGPAAVDGRPRNTRNVGHHGHGPSQLSGREQHAGVRSCGAAFGGELREVAL